MPMVLCTCKKNTKNQAYCKIIYYVLLQYSWCIQAKLEQKTQNSQTHLLGIAFFEHKKHAGSQIACWTKIHTVVFTLIARNYEMTMKWWRCKMTWPFSCTFPLWAKPSEIVPKTKPRSLAYGSEQQNEQCHSWHFQGLTCHICDIMKCMSILASTKIRISRSIHDLLQDLNIS